MSDTPERPVEYKPEEGAEVRPASRYGVTPGGYEALAREVSETRYKSPSVIALTALILAVGYSFIVALGGVAAFWVNAWLLLVLGTILVPLLSVPVALKLNVREPLGLLRIAALALAAFYAGPVGIIGLLAYPNHAPYLLPLWTLLLPVVAIGVALAARLRIQSSEGTLTGIQLTTWAIGLSLFFALGYTAFYTATYIAVRKQAVDFADGWIDRMQKDDLEQAFALTLPPRDRTSDPMSREEIEGLNERRRSPGGEGAFESFSLKPTVRLLSSSLQAQCKFVGVRFWDYESGAYRVILSYQVTSPHYSYPFDVVVIGADVKGDSKGGRRWAVAQDSPGLGRVEPQFTDTGKQYMQLVPSGQVFAYKWIDKLWRGGPFVAVTDTRALEEMDYAGSVAVGLGMRAVRPLPPFFHGALVQSDPKLFWAKSRDRQQYVDRVEQLFTPGNEKVKKADTSFFRIRDIKMTWPTWVEADGRVFYRYAVDIGVPLLIPVETADSILAPKEPTYEPGKGAVEGRLVISCPSSALTSEKPEWRIESLDLVRGRRLDEPNPAGGLQRAPGPPGGPRPGGT